MIMSLSKATKAIWINFTFISFLDLQMLVPIDLHNMDKNPEMLFRISFVFCRGKKAKQIVCNMKRSKL